jgi:Pentapeptide repeats (8 copies)
MPKRVGTAILAVAGVVVVAGLVVWLLPALLTQHPHLATPADRYKAEADVRTGLVALLAVLGGLGGLYYTGRTFRLSKDAQIAERDYSQKTLRLSEEGQITDRYSKAVDQLGDDSPEVSLGGLYALGRIMRDSPRDEQAVVAVLSAFVRRQAKRNDNLAPPWPAGEAERDEVKPSFRVQAALNVISTREHCDLAAVPDLRDCDLRGARLKNAKLHAASFRRSYLFKAHLDGADLSEASLVDADLTDARFDGATLMDADLRRATLTGARFKGVDLNRAWLTIGALGLEQQRAAVNTDKIIWVPLQTAKEHPGRKSEHRDFIPTLRFFVRQNRSVLERFRVYERRRRQ